MNPAYPNNALSVVARILLAVGALMAAVGTIGWLADFDFSKRWYELAIAMLGPVLAIGLVVTAILGCFRARVALDASLIFLAGWAVALTLWKFRLSWILGIGDANTGNSGYWPDTVVVVGSAILFLGSLLLLAGIVASVLRQGGLRGYGVGPLDGMGRGLLILGSLICFAVSIGMLTSWSTKVNMTDLRVRV